MSISESLDRFFKISQRGSTIPTEIKGGIITFLAMVYILPVNVLILQGAFAEGTAPIDALYASTALAAILACILMGLYANFPVALAPGMGINIFIVNTICITMGFTFYQALMAVFISGLLFFIVSVTGFRKKLVDAMPFSMKCAITAGIGLLIAIVGLYNAKIIVGVPGSTPILGDLADPEVILAMFCIVITMVLFFIKRWSAVLVGMILTCVVGALFGIIAINFDPSTFFSVPDFSLIGKFVTNFGSMEIKLIPSFIIAVISLLIVDVFDTTGTLLGIGHISGLADENGDMKDMDKALKVDSVGTMIGAAVGTSTTTSFIESCTGVQNGARTGLMAVVVGLLFIVALFIITPFTWITNACTVGALILVGILMIESVRNINWDDRVMATSAFLTIIIMGLSGSISDGIGFGAIAYCIGQIVVGKWKETSWFMYLIAIIFIVYFVLVKGIIPNL